MFDREDNNVPKDASSTRATILTAAVQALQRSGVEGFTLDAVAHRAGVVKGLVLYHYGSRSRLLRTAASRIVETRDAGLARALSAGDGMRGVDACWEELRRQAEDGTARAWLSLCAAGMIDRTDRNGALEEMARQAVFDGCAVALAAGMPLSDARDAYNALWLALLEVSEQV